MRILMIHNYYQTRGGEDVSTDQEVRRLRAHGHAVHLYTRHNDEIKTWSPAMKARLAGETTWSNRTFREIKQVVYDFRPDIAHVQNFFPLITPSAHYACRSFGVPVVQSLRNYRLFCPIGVFLRNGRVCEACLNHSLWRGVMYACYHDSRLQTATVALMLAVHRRLHTWQRQVAAFVTLSEFARSKAIAGGIPAERVFVRPNFLETDPGTGTDHRDGALFVGRLSPEKGLDTLLDAWAKVAHIPLQIVGDGPLRSWVEDQLATRALPHVTLTGPLPQATVFDKMKTSRLLVMPSRSYETFGRTIMEAYATATPVIASNLGAVGEIVDDGETGWLIPPGDASALAERVNWLWEHPTEAAMMGQQGRRVFEAKYLAQPADDDRLMAIYRHAIASAGS
ncbi:MAG: glycosyltransferase family 4 protein [Chloroflexaceae bacterium]|nr:glycosyltransferase family 4 protein [Chloroflexaceae bacterium]